MFSHAFHVCIVSKNTLLCGGNKEYLSIYLSICIWYIEMASLSPFLARGDFFCYNADNVCKHFGTRSGPTECQTVLNLKELFEKANFENSQQITKIA